jgi:hypothetical protein
VNSIIETIIVLTSLYQNVTTLPLNIALNLAKSRKEAQQKCWCNCKEAEKYK